MISAELQPIVEQGFNYLPILGTLLIGCLTYKQRVWVRQERDGGVCQFPEKHKCNQDKKGQLHVHHIFGQMWGRVQGTPKEQIDCSENVITVCSNAHFDKIHTDQSELHHGRWDQAEFQKIQAKREELANQGEKYWNTLYDNRMLDIANRRTQQAKEKGSEWPEK